MAIIEIKAEELQDKIGKKLGLVQIYSTHCKTCTKALEITEELSKSNRTTRFLKIKVEDNRKYCLDKKIFSLPTTFVYKNGEQVDKLVGAKSKDELQKIIDTL